MTTSSKRYLIASDFDGTLFNTAYSDSKIIGVHEAYQMAFEIMVGQGSRDDYDIISSIANGDAPSEMINKLLKRNREHFLNKAREVYESGTINYLGYLLPECKNQQFVWNDSNPEATMSQMLIGIKLKILLDQIGKRTEKNKIWPTPCEDSLIFLQTIQQLKQEEVPIDLAVISSGHENFITLTFAIWKAPQPDILVTEDDIRPRRYPIEEERRFKPGQFPLALAHHKWLRQQGLNGDNRSFVSNAAESKKRMMYIGDDLYKDTLMAYNGNVVGYLHPQTPWQTIAEMLSRNKHLLDGRPFGEILRPQLVGIEGVRDRGVERM